MEEGVLQRVISICRQKSVSESQFAKMIGSNQKNNKSTIARRTFY